MLIHKVIKGFVILKNRDDKYDPPTTVSTNWKHWKATRDIKTCELCKAEHGKIYSMNDEPNPEPPLHPNCRCVVEPMHSVAIGVATKDGDKGADWWLRNYGLLPDYYISKNDLMALGWKWGESPVKYAPDKMATMGEYRNENGHLPQAPGRIWYEADINYYSGKRNGHRVLWSNDGLIFVTYDHYRTFIEVV